MESGICILQMLRSSLFLAAPRLGMLLRLALPEPHLNSDTKDVVRLSTGQIATLSALVLGLLVASAQGSFQTQSNQIKQITANVILLDNTLARAGPDAQPVRILLRSAVKTLVERIWRGQESAATKSVPFEASTQSELFFDKLLELTPQNDAQRQMQTRAIQIGIDLAQTRVLFCTIGQCDPQAIRGGAGILAHNYLRQLWPFRASKPDNRRGAIRLCTFSIVSDFSGTRFEPSLHWLDGNIQRTIEQCPCAHWSLGGVCCQRVPIEVVRRR
jgi:hypothetical protein